jgi:hypothetical protein
MEARTLDYGAIGWAINHVRHGHKLRRPGWPAGVYIALDPTARSAILLCADDASGKRLKEPVLYSANQRDLLSGDWQLVDPTLPGEYHS